MLIEMYTGPMPGDTARLVLASGSVRAAIRGVAGDGSDLDDPTLEAAILSHRVTARLWTSATPEERAEALASRP